MSLADETDTPGDNSPGTDSKTSSGKRVPGEDESLGRVGASLTSEEWDRLRAPFSRRAYVVKSRATGRAEANLPVDTRPEDGKEGDSNRAVVDLRLRARAVRDRLDRVLRPDGYSYRFEPGPEAAGRFSMFCYLRIGAAVRSGVGTDSALRKAGRVALAEAAMAFGIGASGPVSGPILAERESQYKLPGSVLEALERRGETSCWAPGEGSA